MSKKKKPDKLKETPVTYDDYAVLDDGLRYEVDDGELHLMSPGPGVNHQAISYELQRRMNEDCRSDYVILAAPIDVIFSETEIRQPDLIMIHRDRMSILSMRGVEAAPDLVVEISSEHSLKRDKVDKTATYAKYGVPEYWILDLTNYTLEQRLLKVTDQDNYYELVDVYSGEEPIRSETVSCLRVHMQELINELPELPA